MEISNYPDYIEEQQLFDHAAAEAALLKPLSEAGCRCLIPGLRRSMDELRRCRELTEKRYADAAETPSACSWLLDNHYMAQREYRLCRAAFEGREKLRICAEGPLILELCRGLIRSGRGEVTEERCRTYLDGFQSVTVLSRSELELFPAALKTACLEELAELCRRLTRKGPEGLEQGFGAIFTTLRLFSVLDLEKLMGAVDVQNAILAADPSGHYPKMDAGSKREYLRRLQTMARKQGMPEQELALRLIKEAKAKNTHVGFLLFAEKERRRAAVLYVCAFFLLTLLCTLLPALAFDSLPAALLLLLPVSELVKSLMDLILLRLVPPTRLCRMDLEKLEGGEVRTVLALSALLSDTSSAARLARRLEGLYLACRGERRFLSFALLADLREAGQAELVDDPAVLEAAEREINRLNEKYGGGFLLLSRKRSFDGEKFSPHERKRGAITELAKLLRGEKSTLQISGDSSALPQSRFILTLDSDTRVYPGAAGELIGAMLHPLNTPCIDGDTGLVTRGYGIIQPRISTELKSASETDFALIFAGAGGSDPYGGLCSELYMDAFQSGGFAGKGIIDAESLLYCTGKRFPEGRILSHDALEGAYLRAAFMGDTEFSDSFPSRPLAYYKRLHRWVRGDWQNSPWIFKKELPLIERFRLFDSLRRSLIAPATLMALLTGFYFPGSAVTLAAWAALLAFLSRLFICLGQEAVKKRESVPLRRYTRVLTGAGGAIVQTFMRLWLLPYEAWVSLSALCTALWRMLISHRGLLQWQTAAQTHSGTGLAEHVRAMLQPLALGFLLLISAPTVIGRATGLMWLLSPAVAAALSLPVKGPKGLSRTDRDYLLSAAAESWHYLESFSGAGDNYLPPDNFQEQPPVGVAHRTSPTNIGLAMASAVAAFDMGIIKEEKSLVYISRCLSSLERMPGCMGHFYNWYDTETLRPLPPLYISTVDSGNLYAALICVRAFLRERGDNELYTRLSALMEKMDFSPLFDEERKLFYICYDTEKQRGAGGWYDLMASEAMLTSYIAIAKGDVPIKHWRRLSRAQLQNDGYRGLASWTGTMFEYLMPELFLPFYPGSLLWESGRFCLYSQKKSRFAGKPWGLSESAFYSLDPSLCYRYKAHGCSALALKRGQDADMVVSPYSSFLALSVDAEGAVRNLRRLEGLGARGRWGFIEALDFTPARSRREGGEKVRCYMAHHVGMSIIAAANALCGGSMQRRFMEEPACAAYSLLLQEKLGDDAPVIRRESGLSPEQEQRRGRSFWQVRGSAGEGDEHHSLFTNGAYGIIASSKGYSRAAMGSLCVYEGSFRAGLIADGKRRELFSDRDSESWEISEEQLCISHEHEGISARCSLYAAAGEWGEGRLIRLKSRIACRAALCLEFVPLLADFKDYVNHPAFWKLGIEAEYEGSYLLLHRLRRGEARDIWLCVGCSDPSAQLFPEEGSSGGSLSEPHVKLSLELDFAPGEKKELAFALCLGLDREEALEGARRIIKGGDRACLTGAIAAHMQLSAAETGAAMAMLGTLRKTKLRDAAPRDSLWQFGISGELPLICCESRAIEALPLLRRFCLLKSCGFDAELVYLSDEEGEYQQPMRRRIAEALSSLGLEALLGSKGGVHFAPMWAREIIESRSAVCIGRAPMQGSALMLQLPSAPRRRGCVPDHSWEGSEFMFYVNQSLPSRGWQQMLSNGSLGCIVCETGPAALWYKNARELPLVKPMESIRGLFGGETLLCRLGGSEYSLFAANDNLPCRVSYGPGYARWEKELFGRKVQSTFFIAPGTDARVIIIRGAEGMELSWSIQPALTHHESAALSCRAEGCLFRCENPESFLPVELLAFSDAAYECLTDFTPAAMLMKLKAGESCLLVCGCCGEEELRSLCLTENALAAFEACQSRWAKLLGRFGISSGIEALDRLLSPWLIYQSIACRLEGRSSLYQSGGAYGFRDQLQDSVNLLLISPEYARERILDCCRHQYAEGDVMHWWHPHPDGARGLRSRCSDDLLWLCWALCEYCEKTGDTELCFIKLPYLSSPPLAEGEPDRYECPPSGKEDTVLAHSIAALEQCIKRGFGPHGLPFFGSGDWNDGLDAVDGESVWLGWFFSVCAYRFSLLLDKLCRPGAARYRKYAEQLGKAADAAWGGDHYYRGYLSDGSVLGGEERIDSLAQSWAAFCPYADEEKVRRALKSSVERLYDAERGIVKIFDPPFDSTEPYPGYIVSYGKGFRENGGQYTHAAIWLAMACLQREMKEEGFGLLKALIPSLRDLSRYEAEPYVLSADVYSAPGHEGEAGWSWYTGSAAWYFRAVTESLLGIKTEAGELRLCAAPPLSLSPCRVSWTNYSGKRFLIEINKGESRIKELKERD